MFLRTVRRSFLTVGAAVLGLALSGCGTVAGRFAARSVERLFDRTESVANKITSPLRDSVGLSVLWVGHATVLIQIHEKVFLTDPVFTNTAGLIARRSIAPGLDPTSIPRVDFTLISHIHFDHLNYSSLGMLPKQGELIIPLGGAEYTPEFGFAATVELRQWETFERDGVRITAVPVRHFAGRYGFDILWMKDRGYTGYIIEYHGTTVFFAGDTGYDPELFKEIGRRYRIDLAFIPIAPIEPREFMQRVHADPSDALQIFADTKARLMVPMHFQTFFQGLDPRPEYAQELLKSAVEERGLQDRVIRLAVGEQRVFVP